MKGNTPAALAKGWQQLIGPALILVMVAFPFVFFVPLFTTRVSIISYNEVLLARVAYDLFFFDKFLFVVVFVFGILIPAIKMVAAIIFWYGFRIELADRCKVSFLFLVSCRCLISCLWLVHNSLQGDGHWRSTSSVWTVYLFGTRRRILNPKSGSDWVF
jgi:hypothetical protein